MEHLAETTSADGEQRKPQGKRVTITDIAKMAGVSPGAVSFALNGRPGVSEQTRQRILTIAAEHEWVSSSAARALVGSRAAVIVIDPRDEDPRLTALREMDLPPWGAVLLLSSPVPPNSSTPACA